jgi:anti-sigma factor NepR-like protein
MATLIGPVPPGLTFPALAGGTMTDTPALDRETQDHLGQQLRAMYEHLLEEPIPGQLLVLIAHLERQDQRQSDEC